MRDLRDELLVPLGSVVMPAGTAGRPLRRPPVGHRAGRLGGARPRARRPRARGPAARRAGGRGAAVPRCRWTWASADSHAAVEVTGGLGRPPGGPAGHAPAPARPARAAARPARRPGRRPCGPGSTHDQTRLARRDPVAPAPGARPRGAVRAAAGRPAAGRAGRAVEAGEPLLEHLRDRRIAEVDPGAARTEEPRPGQVLAGRHRPGAATASTTWRGAARAGAGQARPLAARDGRASRPAASPLGGVVTEVRPGAEIRVRAAGLALRGAFAAGSAAHGRLELATDPFGELRPGGIDVGRAGSILVVGSRIDAEALTRARAMGVRGIVVASLPGKELRDFQASERRQRAALHPAPPFGVLALEGALRRPIAPPGGRPARAAGRDARSRCSSTRLRSCSRRSPRAAARAARPGADPERRRTRASRAGCSALRACAGSRPAWSWRRPGWRSRTSRRLDVPLGDLERFA